MVPINVLLTLAFTADQIEKLQNVSPRLAITQVTTSDSADLAEYLPETHILYTLRVVPRPKEAPHLQWIQLHSAGIDSILSHPVYTDTDITLTSTSGIHAVQMGEYVLAQMLALAHHLPTMFADKVAATWPSNRWQRYVPQELYGATVGIIGYGSIGRQVARLAQIFGMKILALKGDVRQLEAQGYTLPGIGDIQGDIPDRVYPVEALNSFLAACDYVVLTIPYTRDTHHLINAEALAHMKSAAFLINVSRGGVIDEEALIDALRENKIGGAALDVFAQEPLPNDSLLWELPNLIISPHVSGFTPHYDERAADLFAENLRRFVAGEPLLNQIDRSRDY